MGHQCQKTLPTLFVPEGARIGMHHRAVVVLGTATQAVAAVQDKQVIIGGQAGIRGGKHLDGCGDKGTNITRESLFVAIPDAVNQKIDGDA